MSAGRPRAWVGNTGYGMGVLRDVYRTGVGEGGWWWVRRRGRDSSRAGRVRARKWGMEEERWSFRC